MVARMPLIGSFSASWMALVVTAIRRMIVGRELPDASGGLFPPIVVASCFELGVALIVSGEGDYALTRCEGSELC